MHVSRHTSSQDSLETAFLRSVVVHSRRVHVVEAEGECPHLLVDNTAPVGAA